MGSSAHLSPAREYAFSDHDFRFLAEIANSKTGIVLNEQKRDMVYSRVSRRLRALGLTAFSQYCDLLKTKEGDAELGNLVNAITTNLTHFFREKHHFEHLQQEVLMPLQASDARRVRIWSAGCSSGMEPYSIALTMQHALRNVERWDARILATDIDTNMLAAGEQGQYALAEYDNIPQVMREHVVCRTREETMQMADSLKRLIAFKYLNLLEPWPMRGKFDAIFCRNVVIYFDKETQAVLFNRMAEMLEIGGWLYIGHSENLTHVCNRFELMGRTIYRKVR
jgi:chemotaxis protein methyltransferase CheR